MGYIDRQCELIEQIAKSNKLTPAQQSEAYELVILLIHSDAAVESYQEVYGDGDGLYRPDAAAKRELGIRLLEEMNAGFVDAVHLNRLLKGAGIKWYGSRVGEKNWIEKNRAYLSEDALGEIQRLSGKGAAKSQFCPPARLRTATLRPTFQEIEELSRMIQRDVKKQTNNIETSTAVSREGEHMESNTDNPIAGRPNDHLPELVKQTVRLMFALAAGEAGTNNIPAISGDNLTAVTEMWNGSTQQIVCPCHPELPARLVYSGITGVYHVIALLCTKCGEKFVEARRSESKRSPELVKPVIIKVAAAEKLDPATDAGRFQQSA